jgi:hypothetical protein
MAPLKRRFFSAKDSPRPAQIVATVVYALPILRGASRSMLCEALCLSGGRATYRLDHLWGKMKVHHIERVLVRIQPVPESTYRLLF